MLVDRTIGMRWAFLALFIFTSLAYAGTKEAEISVELDKAGDVAEVLYEEGTTVISITSWSGIGGAKLALEDGDWPERLVIRLNLSNLESFGMNNGRIRTHTSLRSPRRVPFWKAGDKKDRAAGTLECEVVKTESSVEVVVPAEMLRGDPEQIRLSWINEFRS